MTRRSWIGTVIGGITAALGLSSAKAEAVVAEATTMKVNPPSLHKVITVYEREGDAWTRYTLVDGKIMRSTYLKKFPFHVLNMRPPFYMP